jgi:predicted N-formylglutamate amidohydrolase
VVLSCEHAGHAVPPRWRPLFADAGALLESHRGWDPGALVLARALAGMLGVPLIAHRVTRLLVDPNRSRSHPALFSERTRALPRAERERILRLHWTPHRERVARAVGEGLRGGGRVAHLGVHSFTPVWRGVPRAVDLGLLYDPRRAAERRLCERWQGHLARLAPDLCVRRNQPYRGAADGLTTALRRRFGPRYLGIEIETSQALLAAGAAASRALARALAEGFEAAADRARTTVR